MPLYDFCCVGCNHEFSKRLSSKEIGNITISCPECGNNVERIYNSLLRIEEKKKQVGDDVKKYIQDCKDITARYREELKNNRGTMK